MKHKIFGGKRLEGLAFVLFIISFIAISIFHEPWFDEAQAWEIAKGASFNEILFLIPHYEGHPPLWHLILMVPARFGVPFEVGLKSVGAIISITTAAILIFRSNLPRIARLCLPFSYFFFYQYGIIVRPYGLMMLVLLILGIKLHEAREHPWQITALLGLLCLCSAYGMIIAGGIAICLTIEICIDKGFKNAVQELFKDARTTSLLTLLLFAILLLLNIVPKEDTFYAASNGTNPFILCLICALLTFPAECFLTSASWFKADRTLLQTSYIETGELVALCFVGVVLWTLIISSASKKNLKYLLIPYIFLAVFSAKVYFSGHHLGVVFMFFLFWAEYISRDKNKFEIGNGLVNKIGSEQKDYLLVRFTCIAIGTTCMIVTLVWTICASMHEVEYSYYYARGVAEFLKDNGLSECYIFGSWHEDGSLVPLSEEDESYVNTVMIGTAVPVNSYFGKNVFYNLNHNDRNRGFMYHRRPTLDESKTDLEEWRSFGPPDVIVGKPDLELVFGDKLTYDDYSLVALEKTKFVWKANMSSGMMPVFLRNDILDRYQLDVLEGIEYTAVNGLSITEEMRERFYNGEPVEDILDPYLDVLFGEN